MRYFVAIVFLTVISCAEVPEPHDSQSPALKMTRVIQFPCNKFNGSEDWVECIPVRIDLSQYSNLIGAEMTYLLVTTRGSSFMMAELYDRTNQRSILLSQVVSSVQPSLFSKQKSENILDYLPKKSAELVIRFRNSEDGPEGYINNYSYLTLIFQ